MSLGVQRSQAVVDVHHVGGLDEGMGKILVGPIEGMVDFERSAAFADVPSDGNVSTTVYAEHLDVRAPNPWRIRPPEPVLNCAAVPAVRLLDIVRT